MSETAGAVRVLPFRVRPLPDEPFDSWLEASAAANRATVAEMACALGLVEQEGGRAVSATSWMAAQWATELTDEQASRLERSTGIPAAQFQEMTRMRFARHAIRYTRQGRISFRCPVGGMAGRYCPECLADSGGRWRMSWQFPFTFACVRHRRILADNCPVCHKPPRHTGHPLAGIPHPGHCHNPVAGAGTGPIASRCRGDLTAHPERIAAPDPALHAQRRMMQILSTGEGRFGIYADAPQPAITVLEDIRLLTRAAGVTLCDGGDLDMPELETDLLAAVPRDKHEWTWAGPPTAAGGAVGTTIAIAALEDPDRAVRLLAGRLAVSTSYTGQTPQLQRLIAASLGRTRRPTLFLQAAPASDVNPEERARKVPAQLWDEWTNALTPRRINGDVAASALAAAVVFTGTRLTHSAALALLDSTAPIRQVTHVMREFGRPGAETPALAAILNLAAYLDSHETPIDYARRRRLDCTELLPEEEWQQLCARLNVQPGSGARHRHARAHLYRAITGNSMRRAPEAWDAAGISPRTVTTFTKTLPDTVRRELNDIGRAFLLRRGIDEPLSWAPPLSTHIEPAVRSDPVGEWATARPVRGALDTPSRSRELIAQYGEGATTYELARRTGVSRQTVSRVLADGNSTLRRGRPTTFVIDEAWLRERYETEGMTLRQIAALVGCSAPTIAHRIQAAGITMRPGPHDRTPHPLAGRSRLLQRALVGRHPIERARRFLIATQHDNVRAAAATIRTTQSSLSAQLASLGADVGGGLFVAAARNRPMRLTPLGERLARELHRALAADPHTQTTSPTEEKKASWPRRSGPPVVCNGQHGSA
ncbi:TniQ family protein [Microbacterium sp. STF-2]|uniref:TniQ family protein n=6 Tax=Microbacterium TaxID=33882 RepID=UPI002AFF259B|nr:TniQ family protein [Microbacterium sp. STF-2]MEA1263680.1 TniQ family protein [Microbacterium sp. STF-2]